MPEKLPDYRTTIESIARTKGSVVSVFADFVKISACAVACQTREEEYLETIAKYSQEEAQQLSQAFANMVLEMERKPFSDVLGTYYETINSKSARQGRGEFYTPEHISEFMAQIVMDVGKIIEENKPVTICEPACGGGGMILQVAKQLAPVRTNLEKSYVDLLRVTAQDLSPISCDMTYVNTTLWGIPTQIRQGNTLANEVINCWNNLHWVRVGEDKRQQFLSVMELIKSPPSNSNEEEQQISPPAPASFDYNIREQMDLF